MKRFAMLLMIISSFMIASCNSRHVAGTPDTTRPAISSVSPLNNATGVAVNAAITVTFSEAMNVSTINDTSFLVTSATTGTITGTVTSDASGIVYTFTPNSPLEHNIKHTVTITTAVQDSAGNALGSLSSWSFTTLGADHLDATFGSGGKVRAALSTIASDEIAYAAAIQSDGKIVTAGLSAVYSSLTNTNYFTVARFQTNGALDMNFNPTFSPGKNDHFIGRAFAVALQSDGKIVAAGSSGSLAGSNSDFLIVRYNGDGSSDISFGTASPLDGRSIVALGGTRDSARALAIQADGMIVVTGESTTNNGNTYQAVIARLDTNGTLDSTFGNAGIVTYNAPLTSHAYVVKIQSSDDKIVVGGIFKDVDENTQGLTSSYLLRYGSNGALDSSFGTGGIVTVSTGTNTVIAGMEILQGGKIIIAGTTNNNTNSTNDLFLMRFNSDGTLDTTFGSSGIVTTDDAYQGDATVAGLTIQQEDGKIIVAATYLSPVPSQTNNFALFRYSADGVLDTTFGAGSGMVTTDFGRSDYAECVQIQQDGKIVVVGAVSNGSNYDIGLARYWP